MTLCVPVPASQPPAKRIPAGLPPLIALVAALSTPYAASGEEAAGMPAASRPNILLVLADDLGYSDIGCFGGEIRTPTIDGLARNGLRFTQFYNGSRCCPTRASLLTGLYPHQAGVGDMTGDAGPESPGYRGFLQPHCVTIAEILKGAGYRTYMVGKWHLSDRVKPTERGFDEFYGMLGGFNTFWKEDPHYTRWPAGRPRRPVAPGTFYSTDVFADYALDFLADARKHKGAPWFLYLAFNAPHFPLHAPEEEIAKYEEHYLRGWDRVREERHARLIELGILPSGTKLTPRSEIPANRFNRETGWADKVNPPWESLPEDRRRDLARRMAVFAGMVDRMDQAIGRVVEDLRGNGELERTLILFLSDNGACAEWDPWGFDGSSGPTNILHSGDDLKRVGGPESYISYGSGWANACNAPWRLYKHYGQEGGIATPLVAHWPAGMARKGEIEPCPGHIIDILATCIEVAGASYPKEREGVAVLPMAGRSLLSAMRGLPCGESRRLFFEHEGNRAVRDGRWKLVAVGGKPWELYDMDADRTELEDLASARPEVVGRLSRAWEEWARSSRVLPKPRRRRRGKRERRKSPGPLLKERGRLPDRRLCASLRAQ